MALEKTLRLSAKSLGDNGCAPRLYIWFTSCSKAQAEQNFAGAGPFCPSVFRWRHFCPWFFRCMYATTGGVCARHCSTVFMKHVFPRLRSPTPMPPLALDDPLGDDPLDIGVV